MASCSVSGSAWTSPYRAPLRLLPATVHFAIATQLPLDKIGSPLSVIWLWISWW